MKENEKAHAVPAIPNRNKDGTRMIFRLKRSANTPKIGVNMMPGRVKKVISNPILFVETSSDRAIEGNAGATLETPITAVSVTPKIM